MRPQQCFAGSIAHENGGSISGDHQHVSAAWADPLNDGKDAYSRRDYATALAIFRPLAAQGNAEAQYDLGVAYANGHGVALDDAEAVKWYRLAAAQGHAKAQFALGSRSAYGQGDVKPNPAEAVKWFRLAAVKGHTGARYRLGVAYLKGQGVAKDVVRAYMWFNLMEGNASVLKTDSSFVKRMTPQQIAQAQTMARECQARNFKDCD